MPPKYSIGQWVIVEGSRTFQHTNGDLFRVESVSEDAPYLYRCTWIKALHITPNGSSGIPEYLLTDGSAEAEMLKMVAEMAGVPDNIQLAWALFEMQKRINAVEQNIANTL